jgi:hypothetical protein
VTVVVATRDRGDRIEPLLVSLLGSTRGAFDVVVVDQSRGTEMERAVRSVADGNERVADRRSAATGLSAARNLDVSLAGGDVVALTEDDCEVAPHWLDAIVGHLDREPAAGLLFGEVVAAPHDAGSGFVPTCSVPRRALVSDPRQQRRYRGIGANMAARRDAGEDRAVRREARGRRRVPLVRGDRPGVPCAPVRDRGAVRARRAGRSRRLPDLGAGAPAAAPHRPGQGGTYMKHLRLGDLAVFPTLLREWFGCISWSRLLLLRPRTGLGWFRAFALGMVRSFAYPVDQVERIYRT